MGELARNLAPIFPLRRTGHRDERPGPRAPSTEMPTVYLYNLVPGGVGLAQKLFDVRERLAEACLALAKACECENGCPGCISPQSSQTARPSAPPPACWNDLSGSQALSN